MTQQEGIKHLKRLLGSQAGWRDSGVMTSEDKRAHGLTLRDDYKQTYETLKAQRDELRRRLLDVPEYQALVQATKDACEALERSRWAGREYRLTVGLNKSWCFEVKAQGDNWADVIRKLEATVATTAEVAR